MPDTSKPEPAVPVTESPVKVRRFQDLIPVADQIIGAEGAMSGSDEARPRPSIAIDWKTYGRFLEESDWDDARKQEFIELLWSLVVSFIDLGFELNPLQHTRSDVDVSDVLDAEG